MPRPFALADAVVLAAFMPALAKTPQGIACKPIGG